MDPNPTTRITRVSTIQLLVTLGIIVGVEAALSHVPAGALIQTGMARCLEIFLILALFYLSDTDKGAAAIGLSKNRFLHGLNKGIIWSLGFAGVSAIAGCLLFLAGINPVHFFHGRVPDRTLEVVLLYIVGGIIAPVAEEIFFRGVVYGYVKGRLASISRGWAVLAALLVSTGLFVAAHQTGSGVPLPQLVGGIVFCLSYEIEKSLITPMIIHSTGNMALFTLSFF